MIDTLMPMIKQFLPFAQERMGFKDPPRLFVRKDEQNAQNPLGKTAFYDPGAKSVTLYIMDRHPKDVMRSLSHELVHHTQNCDGQFDNVGQMGDGYAQNDSHLREMERQAYEIGNLCFRDWEDSIKQTIYFEHLQKGVEKVMSTKDWKNGEIKTLLTEKWGFQMDLSRLDENCGPDAAGEVVVDLGAGDEEMAGGEGPQDPQALVDDIMAKLADLQSALGGGGEEFGGGAGGEVTVMDVQERLRRALRKALVEKSGGWEKGDESKTDPGAHDEGSEEGDESDTHPGTDYSKRHPHHKVAGPGDEDDSEKGSEKEHYKVNAMSDEDHIKAIEHHLDALRGDEKYDKEKEEDLEERRGRGRADPRIQRGPADSRARPMEEAKKAAFTRAIRKALTKSITKK